MAGRENPQGEGQHQEVCAQQPIEVGANVGGERSVLDCVPLFALLLERSFERWELTSVEDRVVAPSVQVDGLDRVALCFQALACGVRPRGVEGGGFGVGVDDECRGTGDGLGAHGPIISINRDPSI